MQIDHSVLRRKESEILRYLESNANTLVTCDDILKAVWGPERFGEPELVRVYISTLRKKIAPMEIRTVRPASYMLVRSELAA